MIEDTPTPQTPPSQDILADHKVFQQEDAVAAARRIADQEKAADEALAVKQQKTGRRDTALAAGALVAGAALLVPLAYQAAENTAQQNADVGQHAIDQQNASDARHSFDQGMDSGKVTIDVPTPAPTESTIPTVQQIDPNLQLPTLASPDTH